MTGAVGTKSLASRRNLLRGAGVCLALPWLESLAPRRAAAQPAGVPKRYIPISFPCGAAGQWWDNAPVFGSSVFGDQFVLSAVHQPLAALKSKLLLLSRVGNYSWNEMPSEQHFLGPSPHARGTAGLLTCVSADRLAAEAGLNPASAIINGVSVDQLIAQMGNFAALTPLESLQVGLGTYPGAFDGRSWACSQALSWKAERMPLKRQINPKAVFDALVTGGAPDSDLEIRRRMAESKSVLDAVLEDANDLKPRLGRSDRLALEQFTTAFRELERRVPLGPASCFTLAPPQDIPDAAVPLSGLRQGDMGYDRAAHARLMNDLIVMALQCDVTRLVTYMLDDARSEFDYSFIPEEDRVFGDTSGIENHHGGGHHGPNDVTSIPRDGVYGGGSNGAYATVTRWWVRQVADLAGKLDAVQEADGTLLDHTLIQMTSEMRTHDHCAFDLPLLLLGGRGFLKQNGHVALAAAPDDRQLRDLYYTIGRQYFGLDVEKFGDGPTPNALIEEILA